MRNFRAVMDGMEEPEHKPEYNLTAYHLFYFRYTNLNWLFLWKAKPLFEIRLTWLKQIAKCVATISV